MTEGDELSLRLQALQLAVSSSAHGERHEVILGRAQKYLDFMKGTQDNG